jgi:peptidoglycan lytic transglycosylase F
MTKYFKNQWQMRTAASEERSDRAGELSAYDPLVKKYATMYEFDWRLVTAQMFRNPASTRPSGAGPARWV